MILAAPHRPRRPEGVPHRAVQWDSARRARFTVHHHYRYAYGAPITNLTQRLVMVPPDEHEDQQLLGYSLRVTGTDGLHTVRWERDRFGNRVAHVSVPRVREAVSFEADYRVSRSARSTDAPTQIMLSGPNVSTYLEPTALTAPDDRLRGVAQWIMRQVDLSGCTGDAEALADAAHDWASGAIRYGTGVTGVSTPAAMALHMGHGVCQDYAHIFLALLRLLGVPGRYISGHLLGEGVPHAWAEALVPQDSSFRVIPFDPTHHRRAGLQYITVAAGRDYADVSPTSGSFIGAAPGVMSWGKRATVEDVEYER